MLVSQMSCQAYREGYSRQLKLSPLGTAPAPPAAPPRPGRRGRPRADEDGLDRERILHGGDDTQAAPQRGQVPPGVMPTDEDDPSATLDGQLSDGKPLNC